MASITADTVQLTTKFRPTGECRHVFLKRRRWDDGGCRTLFSVVLDDGRGERRVLGSVKILERGRRETTLPETMFDNLSEEYCSLGQSPCYDREVARLKQASGLDLRSALRDVRDLSHGERERFASEPGFDESLLRFAPARYLYLYAIKKLPRVLEVGLKIPLTGFETPHELSLDLNPDRMLGRLSVVIGENGTGKTRFLDGVARAFSGLRSDWVSSGTPSISRVLALSCSAFDEFLIPQPLLEDSYFYIGLRSHKGIIDVKEIAASVAKFVSERIQPESRRLKVWGQVMANFGLDHLIGLDPASIEKSIRQLGAGYKFACYVFTKVISAIEPRSFILFDEPENHTHPRLLSMMMRSLHRILEEFESFALIATHSPLIVQELPRRQVHLLRCFEGLYPQFTCPADETFGASLSELARKVFALDHGSANFEALLRDLVEQFGPVRVRDEFADELALAARLLFDKLAAEVKAE